MPDKPTIHSDGPFPRVVVPTQFQPGWYMGPQGWGYYPHGTNGGWYIETPATKKKKPKKKKGKSKKGRRAARSARPKKPPTVRVHVASGAGSAGGTSHSSVYASSTQNGGALAALDLSADGGLTDVLVELVGQGRISLGRALELFGTEQNRVTNRVFRRPGGVARPLGV